jgi:hypothetical protein
MRALLRLRHDLVIIGRAAAVPPLSSSKYGSDPRSRWVVETSADYLRASGAALMVRRGPPPLDAVDRPLDAYAAEIANARHDPLTQDLPSDQLERISRSASRSTNYARIFIDVARCTTERDRTPLTT